MSPEDYILPGMPNLHSHAFQRALAGQTELATGNKDDFWSWRKKMYHCANRMTPDQLQAVAAQLFMEMLKSGYTSVAEFHYLHHTGQGQSAGPSTEMADAVIAASEEAGIGLTLLPVLYMTADFDRPEPLPEQARFINDVDSFLSLLACLRGRQGGNMNMGAAFHSLRAVPGRSLLEVLRILTEEDIDCPIHIHIAETRKEVEACTGFCGLTPVRWLFENVDIDRRWCLVHATHLTDWEVGKLSMSECVIGLCPTTEANLGDGIFRFADFLGGGGKFGIGSDSNISVSPVEELRWLEYGQRLITNRRNISATGDEPHVGTFLWENAASGGARALGCEIHSPGTEDPADLLVLNGEHPLLYGKPAHEITDSFVFSGNDNLVRDVKAGGKWVVRDGVHVNEQEISARYKKAMKELNQ